jgi:hypothetical protein
MRTSCVQYAILSRDLDHGSYRDSTLEEEGREAGEVGGGSGGLKNGIGAWRAIKCVLKHGMAYHQVNSTEV